MAIDLQVVGVVAFYMAAALIMVMVNKLVLNDAPNLTILFMFFQSLVTVILLQFTALFTKMVDIPTIDLPTTKKLMPLTVVHAGGFMFAALCLRDVEAAFYQVARGLVLPLTIAVVWMVSKQRPSMAVVGCATLVSVGFFMGVTPSTALPEKAVPKPLGLFYGFLSSVAIAVHAVLIKSSLPVVHGSSTALSYWQNLGAAVIMGIVALLFGEVHEFARMVSSANWDWRTFLYGNIVTGIFGFLISVAGVMSIKVTSPVTHMFSSAARSVLQVALGIKIFGDIMTTQRAASVFTILVGTIVYTWVKHRENSAPPQNEKSPKLPLAGLPDLEAQKSEEIFSADDSDDDIPNMPSTPGRFSHAPDVRVADYDEEKQLGHRAQRSITKFDVPSIKIS
jgi:GDP-fucose transporter C1